MKGEEVLDTFLPMSIKDDSLIIYEPYGSMISRKYECDKLAGSEKYICLCLKNIQDKTTFLSKIASSIRNMQSKMINQTKHFL